MTHLLSRCAFTLWWLGAVLGWAVVAQTGLERSAQPAAQQIVTLMPAWGLPWQLPLSLIRALGVPGGVPYNLELALALGLIGSVLLDVRRSRGANRARVMAPA